MRTQRFILPFVLLSLIGAACLIGSGAATGSTPASASAPVYKTPEEAITAYFDGLAQGDVAKITQACAINEMSEKFKLDLYIQRLGGAFVPPSALAPSDYPLYVEANKMQVKAEIFRQVKIFAYSLLGVEKMSESALVTKGMDSTRSAAFIKDVDPKRLSGLKLTEIGLAGKSVMSNSKYTDNVAKIAATYGADEETERLALFSFEGSYYYTGFTLLRYGQSWKISSQVSPLANTSALGAPQKTTVAEFEAIINK